ncbi:hypothetical protein [Billgrantia endophytica]|uniref:hypothetical protein n=1 Tax=Billgrantia endophytica TaxID=2033802 RepID=UPI001F0C8C3D|nr:hypothetical protein [Halomonas endophytica]
MHQEATKWIAGLLKYRNIPFLICGGLAAKEYGSERDLNDIDLFVPGERLSEVVEAGQEFITKRAHPINLALWAVGIGFAVLLHLSVSCMACSAACSWAVRW